MPIESTYQQPLFVLYKYIPLLLFLFPQLIHRTYQLRYVLHYFFDTYFLFYLCTSLEFWTIIGTVQIQLIHRTYQLRVLDYYRLWAQRHTFDTRFYFIFRNNPDPNRNLFETNLTQTETRYNNVATSELRFTNGGKV